MKPHREILFICLLIISFCAKSQIPPPPPPPPPAAQVKVSRADSLRNEGNIIAAIAEYKKMSEVNPNDYRTIYNYACVLSIGQQADSAFRYLTIAAKLNPTVRPLTDPDFVNIRNDERWPDFENDLVSIISNNPDNSIKDIDYARKLWRLQCMDQYGFYETGIAVKKLGPGSPVVSALRRLQNIIREKNLQELEILLKEKGWPKKSQVGKEASEAAFYVLQHSNGYTQQKYISMFEKCCRENEGNWQQYALMFDRMRMNQNKPQRYGTHAYLDPRAGRINELYPLEDENKVDEWRKEIGLEPLKDYLTRTGIKYVPAP